MSRNNIAAGHAAVKATRTRTAVSETRLHTRRIGYFNLIPGALGVAASLGASLSTLHRHPGCPVRR